MYVEMRRRDVKIRAWLDECVHDKLRVYTYYVCVIVYVRVCACVCVRLRLCACMYVSACVCKVINTQ